MKDTLIIFETAELAKEKGFNIPTINFYNQKKYCTDALGYQTDKLEESNWNNGQGSYPTSPEEVSCSAPTQSLLQKWLREVHNIIIEPIYNQNYNYFDLIVCNISLHLSHHTKAYSTYEKALEEGLQKALKLIK